MKHVAQITLFPFEGKYGGPVGVIKRLYSRANIFMHHGYNIVPMSLSYFISEKRTYATHKDTARGDNSIQALKTLLSKLSKLRILRELKTSHDMLSNTYLKIPSTLASLKVAKYLNDEYDLIHAQDPFTYYVLVKAGIDDHRMILSIHSPGAASKELTRRLNTYRYGIQYLLARRIEVKSILSCRALALPSVSSLILILNDIGLLHLKDQIKPKTYIVYNGVEPLLKSFSLDIKHAMKSYLIQVLNLPNKARYIVTTIGRHVSEKGVDIFVHTAKKAYDKYGEKVQFLLLGDGPLRTVLMKVRPPNCHILGRVAEELKRSILLGTDVYMAPNRVSAFDFALLEAMSAGCAVISTNRGGNAEAVLGTGIITKCNYFELLKALDYVLSDDVILTDFKIRSYNKYLKEFTIDKMILRYVKMYNELI